MSELLAPQQSLPQLADSGQVHLADSETISYMKLDLQYEPKSTNQVKQSKSVTLAHQRRMSVYSKRILARVLEQITEDDTQLREFYQLKVSSIVDDTNLDVVSAYSFAKRALRELSMVRWEFEDLETQEWYFISLLDSSKRRVGIKDGVITIVLNPELTPYFVKIAGQYSTYKLDSYMGLHTWYAMRFYEILSSFQDSGWWEVSLEEYRLLMDCGPELDKWGKPKKDKEGNVIVKLATTKDLIKYTVLNAQKELANTPCAFAYRPVLEKKTGRGRPKIVGLRFDLYEKELTTIPPSWLADKATAAVIHRLREFKVTDKHIAQYLKPLGLIAAQKLVREWQLKENSQQKIDDYLKYCNAAFVRQGKQAIKAKRAEVLQARKHVQQALFTINPLEITPKNK